MFVCLCAFVSIGSRVALSLCLGLSLSSSLFVSMWKPLVWSLGRRQAHCRLASSCSGPARSGQAGLLAAHQIASSLNPKRADQRRHDDEHEHTIMMTMSFFSWSPACYESMILPGSRLSLGIEKEEEEVEVEEEKMDSCLSFVSVFNPARFSPFFLLLLPSLFSCLDSS